MYILSDTQGRAIEADVEGSQIIKISNLMKMYICQHWQCINSVPVFESVIVTADPVVTAPVVVSLVGAIVVNPPAEKNISEVFTGKPAVVSFWHSPGSLAVFFPVM